MPAIYLLTSLGITSSTSASLISLNKLVVRFTLYLVLQAAGKSTGFGSHRHHDNKGRDMQRNKVNAGADVAAVLFSDKLVRGRCSAYRAIQAQ